MTMDDGMKMRKRKRKRKKEGCWKDVGQSERKGRIRGGGQGVEEEQFRCALYWLSAADALASAASDCIGVL